MAYAVAAGCPASTASTRRSSVLAYAVLGPSGSWSSDRTRRWRPSYSRSSCRCRPVIRARRRAGRPDGGRVRTGVHAGRRPAVGFITELLSKPIRDGYMNGIALTVLVSQLPKLFGFSIDDVDPLPRVLGFVRGRARRSNELERRCHWVRRAATASCFSNRWRAISRDPHGRRRCDDRGCLAGSGSYSVGVLRPLPRAALLAHPIGWGSVSSAKSDRWRRRERSFRSPIPACCRARSPCEPAIA